MQISHIIEKEMNGLEGIYSLFFDVAAKVRLLILQSFFIVKTEKRNVEKYFRVFSSFEMTSK